jgi:branched-chain amino acid transport system ATP-binding protein
VTLILEVVALSVEGESGTRLHVDRLSVEGGEVAVVRGPTDSGKTLLAAALCGRVDATGHVSVGGRPLGGGPAARRRHGLAVTVADGERLAGCTVDEALRLAGPSRADAARTRFPLLARRASVRAELLSGGEQQLLQVACAWCADPRALVLDAPTTGLAEDVAEEVRRLARETASAGGAVLWLDQDAQRAPAPAGWSLNGGMLSEVPATASSLDRA